ncbi:hypothetical protein EV192_102196 [Actinocrispum wychmicini]|uniref:Uncharacterized protein n=1 Tax=Actinocrispum wychmicini TaxID=1213861 RepID=A0A4R2JXW6_9PSEU|nr:hypothetical protein EV192_102196 [Actinocrispum wychmicini]
MLAEGDPGCPHIRNHQRRSDQLNKYLSVLTVLSARHLKRSPPFRPTYHGIRRSDNQTASGRAPVQVRTSKRNVRPRPPGPVSGGGPGQPVSGGSGLDVSSTTPIARRTPPTSSSYTTPTVCPASRVSAVTTFGAHFAGSSSKTGPVPSHRPSPSGQAIRRSPGVPGRLAECVDPCPGQRHSRVALTDGWKGSSVAAPLSARVTGISRRSVSANSRKRVEGRLTRAKARSRQARPVRTPHPQMITQGHIVVTVDDLALALRLTASQLAGSPPSALGMA